MKLLVAPHPDDSVLFACFTALRERALVVVVLDGYLQEKRGHPVTAKQRRAEEEAACAILGVPVRFLGFRDDDPMVTAAMIHRRLEALDPEAVYAPAYEQDGHGQHNLVAQACNGLPVVKRYLTYTTRGKSMSEHQVPFEAKWPLLKLKALACYESQIINPALGCVDHFLRSQTEYYAP